MWAHNTRCTEQMDSAGHHTFSCGFGPQKAARHDTLKSKLAKWGRSAGYVARLEQVVPEFGLKQRTRDGQPVFEEAAVDVELSMNYCAPSLLLDTTLRSTVAQWCVSQAAQFDAFHHTGGQRQARPLCPQRRQICCLLRSRNLW